MFQHFPIQEPSSLNIDSRGIQRFLDALEMFGIDIHSLIILRHGKKAVEGYWEPYGPQKTYTLFSASKSFTSIAVGFAVQEALLHEEDRVIDFFPGKLKGAPCENMKLVTVRDLLTMSVGFDEDPHDFPMEGRTDWIYNFLSAYVPNKPGEKFVYSTHASYMLSAIVQKVTGKQTWQYLKERLFQPLGISGEWWEACPQGISTGGWGLMLTTEDFAKFGQFLLQEGCWEGEQLLNAEWIHKAVSFQISNYEHPTANIADAPDFHSGYGYQFWCGRKAGMYFASGGFGQYVIVLPEQDAVIAMTNGTHSDHLFESFWKELYPAFLTEQTDKKGKEAPISDEICLENDRKLAARLADLQIPFPAGEEHNLSIEEKYSGREYLFDENIYGFHSIRFDFHEKTKVTIKVSHQVERFRGENHVIGSFSFLSGFRQWTGGKTCCLTQESNTDWNVLYEDFSSCGAWNGDVYELRMVYDHTPFYDTFCFYFQEQILKVKCRRNIWHYGEHLNKILYGCAKEIEI